MNKKTLLIITTLIIIFTITLSIKNPHTKKYNSLIKENKEYQSCSTDTISINDSNNKYNIKVKEDSYKIKIYLVNTLSNDVKKYNLNNILSSHELNDYSKKYKNIVNKVDELNTNKNTTIDYTKYYNKEYNYIIVDVVLQKETSTCYKRKIKQIPVYDYNNPYINLCNNVLNQEIKNLNEEEFKTYKENISLCKKDNPINTSETKFLESLNNMELNYLSYNKLKEQKEIKNKSIGNTDLYEEIDNPKKTPLLTCKVNSVYLKDVLNEDKLENNTDNLSLNSNDESLLVESNPKPNLYEFKHTEEKDYNYKVYENGRVKEEKKACNVSCTEYLKVNFAPPQSVKAGTCFSYATEVISSTECKTTPQTPPDMKYASSYAPTCTEDLEWKETPDENNEFLSCINKCDKYSMNCSNKCLKEVYNIKETINTSVSLNKNKDFNNIINNTKCKSHKEVPGVGENDINIIYNFFKTHSSGYYKKDDNGKIKFVSNYPGCYWAEYSPFYYTEYGINYLKEHDAHFTKINKMIPSCAIGGRCNEKEIEDGGFMMSYKEDSCNINEENPNCKKDENINCSYLSSNEENTEDILNDYNLTSKSYRESIAECTSVSKARTTKDNKSTFYISIDSNDKKESWTDTNSTGSTDIIDDNNTNNDCLLSSNDKNIILGRDTTDKNKKVGTGGLAYCNNKDYGKWHHYTRWTFPGSWINQKTNKIIDIPPEPEDEGFYKGGYSKYCLPRNSENINTSWEEEYKSNLEKTSTEKEARASINTDQVDKFNILTKAVNFGNYGWNINMRCFYSLKKT